MDCNLHMYAWILCRSTIFATYICMQIDGYAIQKIDWNFNSMDHTYVSGNEPFSFAEGSVIEYGNEQLKYIRSSQMPNETV